MNPYYDSPNATLYHGDCVAVLPTLPGGFGAVVTDPPYGQTNERYDGPDAVSLRPEVWAACYSACGPSAALVAFAGSPTYHRIATAIEAGGWKVRQMWGWVYRDGMITSAYPKEGFDRLAPAMDPIVFATKGKVLLNVEREGESTWQRGHRECGLSARSDGHTATEKATGRRPRTVVSDGVSPFEYFVLPRAGRYRQTNHPNEKPMALMQWLIARLPTANILDPFAGSGTTLAAARAEGRRCVGIELDPAHCAAAANRLGPNPTPEATPGQVA